MITTRLLHTVVRTEVLVLVAAAVVVFAHAVGLKLDDRRSVPRLARGRAALARFVDGADAERDGPLRVLAALPRRVRSRLVEEAAAGMRSGQTGAIGDLAARLGLAGRARRWCGSRRWSLRSRGVHLLTLWGDADVRAELLSDRHPVVRARAIEWAGDHPTPELVELILGRLADPTLMCRCAAEDALLRAEGAATGPLARRLGAATGPDLELLLGLAARRPAPSFQPAALRLLSDARPAVRAGAAAVLGALGGAEGAAGLQALLNDPEPGPRVAAAEGLGRLRHWPAATAVGALLADPSWSVRRAGAEALAAMGAPGTLLLGHYARSSDAGAAEIARYALDTASLRGSRQAGAGP